jgi:hypothetical protein
VSEDVLPASDQHFKLYAGGFEGNGGNAVGEKRPHHRDKDFL